MQLINFQTILNWVYSQYMKYELTRDLKSYNMVHNKGGEPFVVQVFKNVFKAFFHPEKYSQ